MIISFSRHESSPYSLTVAEAKTMSKHKAVKFEYDPNVDAAYLTLARAKVQESEEVEPGVIVDLDVRGQVVGVEILRFAKRFMSQSKRGSKALKKSA